MGLKISLQSKLDEIPPENEWWKSETQRKYYEAADKLIDLGMDPGDAIDLLSDLYWAAAAEFGN